MRAGDEPVDLLLLNASNIPWTPVFPYAFVQVSALARRAGLRVARHDFVTDPVETWPAIVRELVARHRPRMVGLHQRNVDSLMDFLGRKFLPEYLPADATLDLVRVVRAETRAPVIVGGFGFTTHHEMLFEFLGPDLALTGEPDGLFERFEDVLAGRELASVPNLLWRDGGETRKNERVYYPPLDAPEYTDAIFDELDAFYARAFPPADYEGLRPSIAIELMRGCPFRCRFCSEPYVKGRSVRRRDLDAIREDLRTAARRGHGAFFLVCSEINLFGEAIAQEIAQVFLDLKAEFPELPVAWSAYVLPKLEDPRTVELLARSGYTPSQNDLQSLDDDNLRAMRVPYRSDQALAFLDVLQQFDANGKIPTLGFNADTERTFFFFLGNARADLATVRKTLEKISERRLHERFDMAFVIAATRVFELGGERNVSPDDVLVELRRPGEEAIPPLVRPTFAYNRALWDALGGTVEAYYEFWDHVATSYLSNASLPHRDFRGALRAVGPVDVLEGLLPDVARETLDALRAERPPAAGPFAPPDPRGAEVETLARRLATEAHAEAGEALARLGLPTDLDALDRLTAYDAARVLARQLDPALAPHDAVRARLGDLAPRVLGAVAYWLAAKSYRMKPAWPAVLFGPPADVPPVGPAAESPTLAVATP